MSTIIIITPKPQSANKEQLIADIEALRDAGFTVDIIETEKKPDKE